MNAARDTSACVRLERLVNTYVDDELDAIHCCEVEEHLASCDECHQRVDQLRATRASLRNALKMRAPSALRERMAKLMSAERQSLGSSEVVDSEERPQSMRDPAASVVTASDPPPPPPALAKLRYIMPLAAAATIALVFGAMQLQQAETNAASVAAQPTVVPSAPLSIASIDQLMVDLVDQHILSPPLDTTRVSDVRQYEPRYGVRLRPPMLHDAKWQGARMRKPAALMRYVTPTRQHITLYVFDSKRVPVRAGHVVRRHPNVRNIYVGKIRGYNVAAAERDGVGYAVASDIGDERLTKMLIAAARY
jgi:hypothetical protein